MFTADSFFDLFDSWNFYRTIRVDELMVLGKSLAFKSAGCLHY
jgi:hypothetical protein